MYADVAADENGKFKVPTLRNVAKNPPYGHNGYFDTLYDIVHFYNTRDVPEAGWAPPEYPDTMNTEELGDLGLSYDEELARRRLHEDASPTARSCRSRLTEPPRRRGGRGPSAPLRRGRGRRPSGAAPSAFWPAASRLTGARGRA